jgi:hypothetical protein
MGDVVEGLRKLCIQRWLVVARDVQLLERARCVLLKTFPAFTWRERVKPLTPQMGQSAFEEGQGGGGRGRSIIDVTGTEWKW